MAVFDEVGPGSETDAAIWTTLNGDGFQHVLAYDTSRTAIAMYDELKIKSRDQLVAIMGDATRAMFDGKHVASVSRTRPRRFNRTLFAADHPDLYERYLEPAETPEIRLWVPRRSALPVFKLPRNGEAA